MKKLLIVFVAFLLLGFKIGLNAAPVVIADVLNISWDYLDADATASGLTKFQYAVTNLGGVPTAWTDALPNITPIPSLTNITGTTGTGKNYVQSITNVSVGDHTFSLRACNPDVCSPPVSVDFHFTATPRAALNLRLSGKS